MSSGRGLIAASIGALVFAVAMVWLLIPAVGGADLIDPLVFDAPEALVGDSTEALAPLIIAALAGLAGFVGWIVALRSEGTAVGDEREEREQAESEVARLRKAASAQKEWIHKLRGQVQEMQNSQGALSGMDDVRGLVLRVAVLLLEAEMGILMSRRDEDGDGNLDLVASEGFDNDPADSKVVQRFAREVLERDTTVKESGEALAEWREEDADYEIENLIAIPIYIENEFEGVVVCLNSRGFEEHSDDVLVALGDHAGAILQNAQLHGQLRGSYIDTVRVLAEAIEVKDPFLRGHSDEVSDYVARVASELGIEAQRREELVFGSLLHDVGKLGISERILLKPGKLTPEEYAMVQLHPRIGYRLVQNVALLRPIAPAILHHHEWFDGSGYPGGLKGEQIPLEARIISVADAFSAMTSERPYQRRRSLEDACAELERSAGTQFDPEIVRLFVNEVRTGQRDRREDAAKGSRSLLDDPELGAVISEDEPLLGYGAFAITDNLTLLYSHGYLHEVARSEAERSALQAAPFCVVLTELTALAEVNEADGYAVGDEAIKEVAGCVQRIAVRHGASAARMSGRRLALIVPNADDERARAIAEEINSEVDGKHAVRFASACWVAGESGEDVLARARSGLA
ncbi:MAG TPA: HD domain-containing phosphohydrolase [Solirubrobacterales bacterium]|nr:HD domain-containing phosphohydrolase [Solirubrobacterales bacterium]